MQRGASKQADSRSLSTRSLHAVKWNYIGVVARVVSQVVVQITMARILGPEAFGLFALALLVVGIGSIVVEMGLGAALVQKKQISEADVRHVYTLSVLTGVMLAVVACLSAPVFAMLFDDERVTSVIRGLAPAFVLQALSVAPIALLKRDLDLKRAQAVQVGSYLFGFLIVGLGLAYIGAGVWSLVAAWLAQSATLAAAAYAMRRHSLAPLLRGADPAVRGYGFRILLTNLSNWAIENLDNFLVGKFFGAKALGLYSVSYNLVRAPATHLVSALQTTLFSTASRAQDNDVGLRRAYLVAVSGVSLIAVPVFSGIAAVAPSVVEVLLGAKWSGAELVLRPLALAMAAHALMAVAGPVLWGKGAVGVELKIQSMTAVVLVAALVLAKGQSVVLLAWAVFGVYLLRFFAMTVVLLRLLQIEVWTFIRAIRGGLLAAGLLTPAMAALDGFLEHQAPISRLVADIVLAASMLTLFVLVFPRIAVSRDLRDVVQGIGSGLPGSTWLLSRIGTLPDAAERNE